MRVPAWCRRRAETPPRAAPAVAVPHSAVATVRADHTSLRLERAWFQSVQASPSSKPTHMPEVIDCATP